jgi:hypothetical protein
MADLEFKHPSYVAVSFSRRSGNPRLFGSTLQTHYGYVTLVVSHATLVRGEHDDRYDHSISGDLLEIDFSAAQFAELLTTMNVATGTPGTLRRLHNRRIPEPPELPGRVEHIQETFEVDLKATAAEVLGKDVPRARAILEQKTLTKADRHELMTMFDRVARKLTDHAPFVVQMMNEAVTERVSAAKAEVDAVLTSTLNRLGAASMDRVLELGGTVGPAVACAHPRTRPDQRFCHVCGKEYPPPPPMTPTATPMSDPIDRRCADCASYPLRSDQRFCHVCGKEYPATGWDAAICAHCGKNPAFAGSRYCTDCTYEGDDTHD